MSAYVDPIQAFLLGCVILGVIVGLFVLIGAFIIARAVEGAASGSPLLPTSRSSEST